MQPDELVVSKMGPRKYTMFFPKGKQDIRETYKELSDPKYKVFKDLSKDEMKFVWLWSCKASPFHGKPPEKKFDKCFELAFFNPASDPALRLKNNGLAFSPAMKAAFAQMETFEPEHRIMMMLACNAALERLMAEMHNTEVDPEKFASMTKNAIAAMKEINAFIESGDFGITEEPEDPMADLMDELQAYHTKK